MRSIFEALRLTIDDTGLIPALHKGEPAAYEVLYNHYAQSLCLFIDRLVKNAEVAEDIAAEALSKTFARNTSFESLSKLKSFLYTTAYNAALDFLKVDKRHMRAHDDIRYLTETEMDDAELIYIRAEVTRAIQECIDALPGQPQQVIRLAFLEGKKLTEIATELNLSYNTVQNHKARGLQLMKIHLIKNKLLSASCLWLALSTLERH